MRKLLGLRLITGLAVAMGLSACKVVFSTDDSGGGGSLGSCVKVTSDGSGTFHIPYVADGELDLLATAHLQNANEPGFAPVGFAGIFSGEGRVNNFELCYNNICPAIAIAPANYQFARKTRNHSINFGLYELRAGKQGSVGHITLRDDNSIGGGVSNLEDEGRPAQREICVQRIEFVQNSLFMNDLWIGVPANPGGIEGQQPSNGGQPLERTESSPEYIGPPEIMPPIEPPYIRFGSFHGEVRIVTRNSGVITLKDEIQPPPPPPPPPQACVEVPLQGVENGSTNEAFYNFPFRSWGRMLYAESVSGSDPNNGALPIYIKFGFYEAKGQAYEDCFWKDGHLCPLMPEVMPRYSFWRAQKGDHTVRLSFHDLEQNGPTVNGFGRIQVSLAKVQKNLANGSTDRVPKNICVSGLELRTSLSPLEPNADGRLSGEVVVHTRDHGRLLLTDDKSGIEPIDNVVGSN
ncbi:MAG: hypothetical protein H6624_18645 [Bdellovibrionaceae bacterium]|nr:hypothetical protein [Bdellovibrionales bacterium]MCB9086365.1 hypothetical protein [Pseudobdellovibrionaceae bacterium]